MSENNTRSIGWFLVGLGVGAVGAILYAPKSGAETRQEIVDQMENGRDYLIERGAEAREQVNKLVDRGKDVLGRKTVQITSAIDAGREAVHKATRKA